MLTTCAEVATDWSFSVEEVSAGVYLAKGVDKAGRSVEVTGTDPGAALDECKKSAAEVGDPPPPNTGSQPQRHS